MFAACADDTEPPVNRDRYVGGCYDDWYMDFNNLGSYEAAPGVCVVDLADVAWAKSRADSMTPTVMGAWMDTLETTTVTSAGGTMWRFGAKTWGGDGDKEGGAILTLVDPPYNQCTWVRCVRVE